ncbi:hypothetical protein GCM10028857_28730 [Salinarchaeum chitinilyticum]
MSGTDAGGRTDRDADDVSGDDGTAGAAEGEHETLLGALRVTRHARVGLAVGVGLAAILYVPRYPVFDASIAGARGYYLGLAFVLAATTAAVITAALSIKTFLEPVLDGAAWLRRGGVLAMLGGGGWLLAPVAAALVDGGRLDVIFLRNLTSLASLALLLGTIGLHAAITSAGAALDDRLRRVERAAYWVVLIGLLIAAANATGDAAPMTTTDGDAAVTPFLIGAVLATAAVVPFAAIGARSGRLPRWRSRSLAVGGLCSTLGVAWLVALGGWDWLTSIDASAVAIGLAVALVPAGLGWVIAGQGCWAAAEHRETTEIDADADAEPARE